VFSNTGVLKGTVRRGTTPAGATISTTVAGKAIQTVTNGTAYLLTGLPAGTYTWSQPQGYLVLTALSDACDARVAVLTAGPWALSS
jgi:hypothetical protein